MSEPDGRPRVARHAQPHRADHVLAQVQHVDAGPGLGHALRCQLPLHPHRAVHLRDDQGGTDVADATHVSHSEPACVVEAGRGPTGGLLARVVRLAVEEIGRDDRSGGGPPVGARLDAFTRTVRVLHLQLGQQRRDLAVLTGPEHAHVAGVPTGCQIRPDGVDAGSQEFGDVVGLVLDAGAVVRPAGSELVEAHPAAVEVALVQAECRGVQARAGDLPARQPEFVPQLRDGVRHRDDSPPRSATPGRRHPDRRPASVVELQLPPTIGRFLVRGLPGGVGEHLLLTGGGPDDKGGDESRRAFGRVGGGDGDNVVTGPYTVQYVDHRRAFPVLVVRVEVGVGDLDSVHGDGVHVVGGDGERRRRDSGGQLGGTTEPTGRRRRAVGRITLGEPDPGTALEGRRVHEARRCGDPAGAPLPGVHQSGLPRRGSAPAGDVAVGVPDADGPVVARPGFESGTSVGHEDRLAGRDLSAVPDVRVGQARRGGGDADLVGALPSTRPVRGQRPAQAGALGIDPQRVLDVLHGRRRDTQSVALCLCLRLCLSGRRRGHRRHAVHGRCRDRGDRAREHVPPADHYDSSLARNA